MDYVTCSIEHVLQTTEERVRKSCSIDCRTCSVVQIADSSTMPNVRAQVSLGGALVSIGAAIVSLSESLVIS